MHVLMFLGELAIRALPLSAMGTLAAWIVRRRGAEVQHAIWRIVLAGMLALPFLTGILPPLRIFSANSVMKIADSVASVMTPPAVPVPASASRGTYVLPAVSSVSFPRRRSSLPWPALPLVIYAAIAALLLSRIALAVRRAKKAASAGTRVAPELVDDFGYPRPELRESAGVAVPFTIGRRDPVIVLPESWREWDDFKLRSVLAHELAHIRRDDWTTALAAAINRALFWYHPLAWWLERHLAALAEEACDATAIRCAGDGQRYARVLLEFAAVASLRPILGATSVARTSKVGRRIRKIIEGRVTKSHAISGFALTLTLVAALPVIYGAAAFQLAGQAQQQALTKSVAAPYSSMPRIDAVRAILADGWKVTPAEAAKLESELERDPENLSARIHLLSYYTQYMIFPELRAAHLLWLIERHPDSGVFQLGTIVTSVVPDYSGLNSPDIERARALWLRQAERFPANPKVLANAATAFGGPDARIALELVKRARAAEPDNPEWVDWLGEVYAAAVRASIAGGMPRIQVGSGKSLHNPFSLPLIESNLLKSELEVSADAALLEATAVALLRETTLLNDQVRLQGLPERLRAAASDPEVQASEAFGRQLLLRAQQLDPNTSRKYGNVR